MGTPRPIRCAPSPPPAETLKTFSASDAALDGLRVLRAHWRVVAGWSVFNLVALVAMVIFTVIAIFIAAATAGSREAASAAGGLIGGLVGGIGALVIELVVVCGVFRLLLRPEEPAFLHLRLGADEARLGLVWLILGVPFIALVAGVVAAMASVGAFAGIATLAVVGPALLYVGVRLSLAAPATFAARRLALPDSWRATRGRVSAILGMIALALCVLAFLALSIWLVLALAFTAASGFRDWGLVSLSDVGALETRPLAYLAQLLIQLMLAPVLWVISQAPLVYAWKALRPANSDAP